MTEPPPTISTADVRARFDLVLYAKQHFGGEPVAKGDTVRMAGDHLGGLEIKPAEGIWFHFSGAKGGDCFDLVGYRLFADRWNRRDKAMFKTALAEAATFSQTAPRDRERSNGARANGTTPKAEKRMGNHPPTPRSSWKASVTGTYEYVDPQGRRYFVDRTPDKSFPVWHRTESGDEVGGKGPAEWSLYHLDEVVAAAERGTTIFICEGEKDADALRELGFVATTAPGGANAWVRPERTRAYVEALEGADVVLLPDNDSVGLRCMEQASEVLRKAAKSVRTLELPARPENGGDVSDWIAAGGTADELITLVDELEGVIEEGPQDDLELDVLTPWWDNEPPPTEPVLKLVGHRIGSIGNLTGLIAGAGTGKSAVCEAIAANSITPECDGLGFTVMIDRPLLYIDTERTWADHWTGWRRMVRRAGLKFPDERAAQAVFKSFKPVKTVEERRSKLERYLERIKPGLLVLDGIADFIHDVNDAKEANDWMIWLLATAEQMRFGVVGTIHPNPQAGNEKARGHLGSEVWRRAEVVLMIKKDPRTKQRIVTTDTQLGKVRNAEDDLESAFAWDPEQMMFVTVERESALPEGKLVKLRELVELIFSARSSYSYSELWRLVMESENIKERAAQGRVKQMFEENLIIKMPDRSIRLNGSEFA